MAETSREGAAMLRGAPHLSTSDLAELAARLEAERRRLAEFYLGDVRSERAIEFSEAEDVVERAAKEWTRSEESALADSERERLRRVDEALERLRDGSYGLCLESGDPIPVERLRAVPWARYRRDVEEQLELAPHEVAARGAPTR